MKNYGFILFKTLIGLKREKITLKKLDWINLEFFLLQRKVNPQKMLLKL